LIRLLRILLLRLRLLVLLLLGGLRAIARVGDVSSDHASGTCAQQAVVPGKVPGDPAGNGTLDAPRRLSRWRG